MPTSAAATSQDWSMTSQPKPASITPTLNATVPDRFIRRLVEGLAGRAASPVERLQ
jgi:hypothetical protein